MNEYLISSLEQQLKKDPESRVFFRLAEEYRKGGAYDRAMQICLDGIEHHPKYLPARVCLGRCRQNLGLLAEAESDFREVLQTTPDNPHALRGLAHICYARQEWEEALGHYQNLALHDTFDGEVPDRIDDIQRRIAQAGINPPMEEPAQVDGQNPDEGLGSALQDLESITSEESLALEPVEETPELPQTQQDYLEPEELEMVEMAEDIEPDDDPIDNNERFGPVAIMKQAAEVQPEAIIDDGPEESQDRETVAGPEDFVSDSSEVEKERGELVPAHHEDMIPTVSMEDDELEETYQNFESPVQHGTESSVDHIDLEFERALREDEEPPPLLDELDEDALMSSGGEPSSAGLSERDETMLTKGLKHEKMEHFEAAANIYQSLLEKHPGEATVREHLDRVSQFMGSEVGARKKIRLLSNWLDKIKGESIMFRNLIKEIWSTTPGLKNLLLTGVDGIVIVKHHEDEGDEFLAAEAANLIKETQRFGAELGSGTLSFMSSQYDDMTIAVQMITQEYFLLGLLDDPSHLGRIRYHFNLKAYEWYSAIV